MADIEKFSKTADPREVALISREVSRLTTAGWRVGEGKKAEPPTPEQRFLIAQAAVAYGLDPLMGELLLLGSRIYVTAAGLRRHAATRGLRRIFARPLTAAERFDHRVTEDEEAWVAEVYVQGEAEPYISYGYADPDNSAVATVVRWQDNQRTTFLDRRILRNHAETRAISRALRLAFAVPLPLAEDRGPEPLDVTPATAAPTPATTPAPTTVRGRASTLPTPAAPSPAPAPAPAKRPSQQQLMSDPVADLDMLEAAIRSHVHPDDQPDILARVGSMSDAEVSQLARALESSDDPADVLLGRGPR